MNAGDILIWIFRGFGALYFVAGLIAARQAWFLAHSRPEFQRMAAMLETISAEMGEKNEAAEILARDADHARFWWVFIGTLLVVAAGVAMALAHTSAVWLLSAIIVHQMLYFVRQRRHELRAATPVEAEAARVERSTVNGFYAALVMLALSAWLYVDGLLWGPRW